MGVKPCHTPLPLLANVVYKFQCLRDVDKVYIGKTRRHLATRVKEHGHSTHPVPQYVTIYSPAQLVSQNTHPALLELLILPGMILKSP